MLNLRQLLQALRRARHRNRPSPPLRHGCTAILLLLLLTRHGNAQGWHLSVAHFVACISLASRRLPHTPSHTRNAAVTCQGAMTGTAKHWLGLS